MIDTEIKVADLLFEICEDKCVYDENFDLIESELLDSFAFIELFSKLEDLGVILQPTQIDRSMLRTSGKIQKLVDDYMECKGEKNG